MLFFFKLEPMRFADSQWMASRKTNALPQFMIRNYKILYYIINSVEKRNHAYTTEIKD